MLTIPEALAIVNQLIGLVPGVEEINIVAAADQRFRISCRIDGEPFTIDDSVSLHKFMNIATQKVLQAAAV